VKQIQSKLCPGPSHEGPLTLVVEVTEEAYQRWLAGAYIQDVFPDLSLDDRERFISGYCTPCWDQLFPFPEEDGIPEEEFTDYEG
jgi:hypothetical protein